MTRKVYFKVSLTKPETEMVSVRYATQAGTASPVEDFTPTSGLLQFLPGQVEKLVEVTVRDAVTLSPEVNFALVLTQPVNGKLGKASGFFSLVAGPEAVVNGPLIKNGLMTNSYHQEEGRGGYFHWYSGTSEGQSIGIEGAILAHLQLKNGTAEEKEAAAFYLDIAQQMLDAMGDGSGDGPILRQAIPANPDHNVLPHWLFATRGDIPAQAINYKYSAKAVAGKLIIPQFISEDAKGGPDVYRIFMIYPNTSQLLYQSPYSPAYDIENPAGDTSIRIDTVQPATPSVGGNGWTHEGDTVELTLPAGANANTTYVIVYGFNNAATIKQGAGQEAYPNWTNIQSGYASCAPDTFRWFEYALTLAAANDPRTAKATSWANLRNALRRTAIKGQNVTDLREVIKPMPNYPVLPITGEPSGMFCHKSTPQIAGAPPSQELIDQGANPQWLGYYNWSRNGGTDNASLTDEQLDIFTPAHLYDTIGGTPEEWAANPKGYEDNPTFKRFLRGSIEATFERPVFPYGYDENNVLKEKGRYQIGRGINDTWRSANSYQEADQFLMVVHAGDFQNGSYGVQSDNPSQRGSYGYGMMFRPFISTSKTYSDDTRYIADCYDVTGQASNRWAVSSEDPPLNDWYDDTSKAVVRIRKYVIQVDAGRYRVNSHFTDKNAARVNLPWRYSGGVDKSRNSAARSPDKWLDTMYRKNASLIGGHKLAIELIPRNAFVKFSARFGDNRPPIPPVGDATVYPGSWSLTGEKLPLTNDFSVTGWQYGVTQFDGSFLNATPTEDEMLPKDTVIENFGVEIRPSGFQNNQRNAGYGEWQMSGDPQKMRWNLIFMRLVSGPSEEWVRNNLDRAARGSQTPYFPGAMPFAMNADVRNQQFVGFNGNPFHGYQLADLWWSMSAEADAIYPNLNPAVDLPTAAADGSLLFPITANTTGGVAKPRAAMLCEQQLLFLRDAQNKWVSDGGQSGPFAHTFVVNTPARASLGNPTPHTWVYTNDDPNTRWVGYQVRVVESIAKLAWLSRNHTGWANANQLCVTMTINWINRLNAEWPNLNGKPYNDPDRGPITIYGMPTDWDDPRTNGISTKYEEPHAAALILRAVLWALASGKFTNATVTATLHSVGKRCWDYMEMMWRSDEDDTMRYTWALRSATTNEQYYGFWHFEILATISYMLQNPTGIPTGVDPVLLRTRLVEAYRWTKDHVEKE